MCLITVNYSLSDPKIELRASRTAAATKLYYISNRTAQIKSQIILSFYKNICTPWRLWLSNINHGLNKSYLSNHTPTKSTKSNSHLNITQTNKHNSPQNLLNYLSFPQNWQQNLTLHQTTFLLTRKEKLTAYPHCHAISCPQKFVKMSTTMVLLTYWPLAYQLNPYDRCFHGKNCFKTRERYINFTMHISNKKYNTC